MRINSKVTYIATSLLLALSGSCTKAPESSFKRISADQQFSGFLKEYSELKPNPKIDDNALTFINRDGQKHLRAYLAIVVDPIEVYIATNADSAKISEASKTAVTNYFRHALTNAVGDAYPVVEAPGPLVLRLRTALVGVDVGGAVNAGDVPADSKPLAHAVNIGKVGVEMELVDSVTGERIAAMIDKAALGAGAEVGAEQFSKVNKFAAAREAFDEWAWRVRQFLDVSMQLNPEEAAKAVQSYRPYGADTDFNPQ